MQLTKHSISQKICRFYVDSMADDDEINVKMINFVEASYTRLRIFIYYSNKCRFSASDENI